MALTQSRCCVCKGLSARGCQRVQSKGCCTLQQLYPLSLLFSSVISSGANGQTVQSNKL